MNLDNKYFLLSKKVKDSFYDEPDRVGVQGVVKLKEFQTEFKDNLNSEELTSEKAMYIGLQMTTNQLPQISRVLTSYHPVYF